MRLDLQRSPVGKGTSAAPHALSRLKLFADKFVLDLSFAFDAFRSRIGTETIETHVPLLALGAFFASRNVVESAAYFLDVAPSFVIDGFVDFRLDDGFSSRRLRLVVLDLLRAADQSGDVEVVERQRVHHLALQSGIFSEVFAAKTRAGLHRIRTQALGAFVEVFARLRGMRKEENGVISFACWN